jgi:hypothetical protein
MFDFDAHFRDLFNADPPSKGGVSDEAMWDLIHNHGSFFRTMPLIPGAKGFLDALILQGFDPIILTAAAKSNYHDTAIQKRQAVREHLTTEQLILPVYGSGSKTLFMHAPGDILIDDWKKNCDRWEAAGGTALHFQGDFGNMSVRLGMIWGLDGRNRDRGLPFQPVYTDADFRRELGLV